MPPETENDKTTTSKNNHKPKINARGEVRFILVDCPSMSSSNTVSLTELGEQTMDVSERAWQMRSKTAGGLTDNIRVEPRARR